METTAIVALALLLISEALPYLPAFRGNGIVQEIVEVLREVFPVKTDKK